MIFKFSSSSTLSIINNECNEHYDNKKKSGIKQKLIFKSDYQNFEYLNNYLTTNIEDKTNSSEIYTSCLIKRILF